MTEIDMLYPAWEPGGTSLQWEVMRTGTTTWMLLDGDDGDAVAGLPALCRLRLTMIGTADLAPMIQLDAQARVLARRPRGDMAAISKLQAFGLTTSSIRTTWVVDNFIPANHAFTPTIVLADGTIVTASVTSTEIDPNRPGRRSIRSTFTVPGTTTGARLRCAGTTNNVQILYHVESVGMFAM
jgi:hypothetical protein